MPQAESETVDGRSGMDRRTLIKAGAVAGAAAWTAPVIVDSLASPAAAATCPIAFIAAGAFATAQAASISVPRPAVAAGDIVFLAGVYRSDTDRNFSSSGFSLIGRPRNVLGGTPDLVSAVLSQVVGAGGGATNVTLAVDGGGTPFQLAGACFVYRCQRTTPAPVFATAFNTNAAATNFTPPNVNTTGTDNAWIFSAVATSDNNNLNITATPRSFTLRTNNTYQVNLGDGERDLSLGWADRGPISPGASTQLPIWNQANSASDPWCYVSGAIAPSV